MSLEAHVPSLELCIKLKEVGFPQENMFSWCRALRNSTPANEDWNIVESSKLNWQWEKDEKVASPLATELLERLPIGVDIHRSEVGYTCHAVNQECIAAEFTACNALAKMYIYLAKNGYLEGGDNVSRN